MLCGVWRKSSRKIKTRLKEWVSGDGDTCVEEKKQEKKEKKRKRNVWTKRK